MFQKQTVLADMTSLSEKEAYEIFNEHYSRVKAFIQSTVRQDWTAEDLTQETFIRAFNHLPSLKDKSRLKQWLFQIAKNCCMDYFRQQKSKSKKHISAGDPSLMPSFHKQERIMEQQEMSACVLDKFQYLPDNMRMALWLFDVEGFTHKEIAGILNIEVSNVKVRVHRARKKMRKILNDNCKFERDRRNVFVCLPSEDSLGRDFSRLTNDDQ